ncbi:MAG: hypothetical protein WC842_02420 [Candidatus Paceibacterota bacterium]
MCNKNCGMFGGIYGMALIGAAIYYIQHSDTFWMGVVGVLKAIAWPATIMYRALELLSM